MKKQYEVAGGFKVKCILCSKELAYHRSTSYLQDHLLKTHPLEYQTKLKATKKAKQTSLDGMWVEVATSKFIKCITPCQHDLTKKKLQQAMSICYPQFARGGREGIWNSSYLNPVREDLLLE